MGKLVTIIPRMGLIIKPGTCGYGWNARDKTSMDLNELEKGKAPLRIKK